MCDKREVVSIDKATKAPKMRKWRVALISSWLFAAIVVITTGLLIALALMSPLSEEYTMNHRLSYILLSLAGTIAYLASLFATRKPNIRGILILAIELYLFGLFFQLFTLIL